MDYYSLVEKDKTNGKVENISPKVHEINACELKKKNPKVINNSSLLEICLGSVSFSCVFVIFFMSREQQNNSSKIERNELHIRPAAGRTITKSTSVSVLRRPLYF